MQVGDTFKQGRYTIVHKVGWGHFSTVWLAWDYESRREVVVKVQKSARHYTDAALDEIELLKKLNDVEDGGHNYVVQLLDSFEHSGPNGKHVCMVFEVLGDTLLTLIRKRGRKEPFPLHAVRVVTYQLLQALDYSHRKSIIHTDLKPENILLVTPLVPRPSVTEEILTALLQAAVEGREKQGKDTSMQEKDNGEPSNSREALGESLTKNQKKRLKKKKRKGKKKDNKGSQGIDVMHSNCTTTSGAGEDDESEQEDGEVLQAQSENTQAAEHKNGTNHLIGNRIIPVPSVDEVSAYMSSRLKSIELGEDLECRIVDFGNACWTFKHFTDDIQTRQYRSPEVILGVPYHTSADMWSIACLIFELATGELLFDPRRRSRYSRDEDHLALMFELMGLDRLPKVCNAMT